jgi:hypothetical protein
VLKLLNLAEQDAFDKHYVNGNGKGHLNGNGNGKFHAPDDDEVGDGASTTSSVRSARALARYKRMIALTGFFGVYVTWALFAWFIFVRAPALAAPQVTESKLWKPVTLAFNLPPTATSASTQFRLYYEKLLLAYEDRCAPPAPASSFFTRVAAEACHAFCFLVCLLAAISTGR